MRQIVDVARDVLGNVAEFFQTQLEYPESDILIFAAIILHQRCTNENVIMRSAVFSGFFEDRPGRFYTFRPSSEFHVLDVSLKVKEIKKTI